MEQIACQPFDDDYYDQNFRHTEAVEWRDGVLADRVLSDLQRIGVSPSVLGWVKSGRRPAVLSRSLLELRIATRLGLRQVIVDGYRHFQRAPLVLMGPYAADGVENCVVLGELPDAQALLVTSLADHENPDIGYLDHETGKPTWWYDGLSDMLARAETKATAVPATAIGFVTHADETTPSGWPRMKPALRSQLVRLGAMLPGTVAGNQGPVSMPRATLQLLGAGGAFIVGAVGALREGDAVRFGPVSADVGVVPPGMLPIGTVGDRFVLVDLEDPHLENPGLYVTTGSTPAEIGRVTELFAAAKSLA